MTEVPCTDTELVSRTCDGEIEAFGMLVSRYQDYLYNAVSHLVGTGHDAEDLVQEVFMRAYRSVRGFRRKAAFSTWLYGIMLNCVRSHWRRQRRRPAVRSLEGQGEEDDPLPGLASPLDGPLTDVLRKERIEFVRQCIAALPEDLREVIVLRDLQGLSYGELAVSLALPLGTVKSRLFRARSALKERIAPLAGEQM